MESISSLTRVDDREQGRRRMNDGQDRGSEYWQRNNHRCQMVKDGGGGGGERGEKDQWIQPTELELCEGKLRLNEGTADAREENDRTTRMRWMDGPLNPISKPFPIFHLIREIPLISLINGTTFYSLLINNIRFVRTTQQQQAGESFIHSTKFIILGSKYL